MLYFEHPSSSVVGAALSLGEEGLGPKAERDDGQGVMAIGRSAEQVSCMCIKAIEGRAIALEQNGLGFETISEVERKFVGSQCLEALGVWLLEQRNLNELEKKDSGLSPSPDTPKS